ncbi:MAG: DUF5979 domain-containing protein [Acidimicrobiia bacterium]|nr:DUF5979 domain-containing protein [Acidimicrobiia bacterium]
MRRGGGVLAGVVLAVGSLVVGLGSAVGAQGSGPAFLPVQVTKVVTGDAPPGATYVVTIACESGPADPTEVTFTGAGSEIVEIPEKTVCTFTETQAGGATQTSTAAFCRIEAMFCSAEVTGPTSATVRLSPPDGLGFEAEVTFTNVFAAPEVVAAPAFTG